MTNYFLFIILIKSERRECYEMPSLRLGEPHGNHHCGSCGAALPVNGFYQQPYSSYTPCPSPISPMPVSPVSPSHRWVAFVLCFFFGILGIHRFYVGKVGTGLLYLFTGGLCGIGWLIDLIMTACGSFTDKAGLPLKL